MTEEIHLCACGCGGVITKTRRGYAKYLRGHHWKTEDGREFKRQMLLVDNPMKTPEISAKFEGDNNPMRRPEIVEMFRGDNNCMRDPEIKAKHLASVNTPEYKAGQSAGSKARYDAMAHPGDDMVNHHMIYDHADLSKNTMRITRSIHMTLHNLFRKHNIEIPHINTEVI